MSKLVCVKFYNETYLIFLRAPSPLLDARMKEVLPAVQTLLRCAVPTHIGSHYTQQGVVV